jgi:glutamate/tyrosine decarboxylase-like PLP-dependent enzyme
VEKRLTDSLTRVHELARDYIRSRAGRPVFASASIDELRAALGGPLPDNSIDPAAVVEALAKAAEPGLVTTSGPRYFGFVTGGAVPAALGADWLASAWDQNAALNVMSPAAAVVEEVAGGWLTELLGLPASASVGFVSGCGMANATGLAAARHELLRRSGWDVEARGLIGCPPIHLFVGEEVHVSILAALRLIGFGAERPVRVAADAQGRMRPDALRNALASVSGPAIVCAQAGNVNTGAFDPIAEIAAIVRQHTGWLHIDGAFGLWAAASDTLRHHTRGVELADSWATDAHKWLNVPYDSGLVFVAHPAAHRAAMSMHAEYLPRAPDQARDPMDWTPEASRRARGFPIYAALRSLGRRGVADLIDRCCRLARRFVERLSTAPEIQILNDVVLNQVLVRVVPPSANADAATRDVVARVQAERVCWLGGTRWHGMDAMRISVSNWSTTDDDVDRSADSILRAVRRSTWAGRPALSDRAE